MKKLALFNATFNPPGLHHRRIVDELVRQFDTVVIVPCGPRPDKPTTNATRPVDRAVMAERAEVETLGGGSVVKRSHSMMPGSSARPGKPPGSR